MGWGTKSSRPQDAGAVDQRGQLAHRFYGVGHDAFGSAARGEIASLVHVHVTTRVPCTATSQVSVVPKCYSLFPPGAFGAQQGSWQRRQSLRRVRVRMRVRVRVRVRVRGYGAAIDHSRNVASPPSCTNMRALLHKRAYRLVADPRRSLRNGGRAVPEQNAWDGRRQDPPQ